MAQEAVCAVVRAVCLPCFLITMCLSWFDQSYSASWKDLLWQLALGHSERLSLTQFWFHTDLLFLTAVFFLAFRLVRSQRANVYLALAAIAIGYSVQYLGWQMASLASSLALP